MDIAEVARRSGVPASTLRYYEEKGLIRSIGRRGLRRLFAASVLERLAIISMGRSAGLSLDEIARMFAPDGKLQIDRTMLADKADELDSTIRKLTAMRNGLRHAAACPAPSHMECPTFRRLLGLAASEMKSKVKKEASAKQRRSVPPQARRSNGTTRIRS
jgi:DNA-binding transcriptional MerR regulator